MSFEQWALISERKKMYFPFVCINYLYKLKILVTVLFQSLGADLFYVTVFVKNNAFHTEVYYPNEKKEQKQNQNSPKLIQ